MIYHGSEWTTVPESSSCCDEVSHTTPSDSYQGNDVQPVGPLPLPGHTPPRLCFYMSCVLRSQGTVVSVNFGPEAGSLLDADS